MVLFLLILFVLGLGVAIGWIIWSPSVKLDVSEVKIVEEDSRLAPATDRFTRWLLNL